MVPWQKRARVAAAIVGVASVGAVYITFSGRQTAAPPAPIQRSDWKALAEGVKSVGARFAAEKLGNFESERWLAYPDGTRHYGVTVTIIKGSDRSFRVSADEAWAAKGETEIELIGNIRLEDSDGFWLTTDRGRFNQTTSVATVPGAATFGKGRMSGSGRSVAYDQERDVLTVREQAQVTTVDEHGSPTMQFSAGSAVFDRIQHLLTVEASVHVVRESQVIDTDRAEARLTDDNDVITYLRLRGNSKVSGGEARIDAMHARDIDLDYTEDGNTLEAVVLAGDAAIAMIETDGRPGLRIEGKDAVDVALAGDGSLTRATARDNVRLDLPAAAGTARRSIRAELLDAAGEAGRGLTRATFTRNVVFTEQAGTTKTAAERIATAQALDTRLADEAVTAATFTGEVTFEEVGLKACAGRLEYQPDKGSLALSGVTRDGSPMVAEEQVTVEGQTIDVALETRRMTARGSVTAPVKAVLSAPSRRCAPARPRPAAERGATRMPRLLGGSREVTVQGPHLEYDSRSGSAVFSGGRSTLRQEETSIAAARLAIDQGNGNLTATGEAFSTLIVDGESTVGRAHEIRYTDDDRRVRFATASPRDNTGPTGKAQDTVAATPRTEATLTSKNSVLRATDYIELRLAADDNTVERIQAEGSIHAVDGNHIVTGGSRLDYDGASGAYEVIAARGRQVTVAVRRDGACRANYGRLVRFHKGREGVTIDGRGVQDVSTGPSESACAPAAR